MWRMTPTLNSKLDYIGQNNTKIQIFPFNFLKHLKSVKRDSKNVSIRHKRCSFSYITKMWRMALLIRHNCDLKCDLKYLFPEFSWCAHEMAISSGKLSNLVEKM
jgi:hypothetical protein